MNEATRISRTCPAKPCGTRFGIAATPAMRFKLSSQCRVQAQVPDGVAGVAAKRSPQPLGAHYRSTPATPFHSLDAAQDSIPGRAIQALTRRKPVHSFDSCTHICLNAHPLPKRPSDSPWRNVCHPGLHISRDPQSCRFNSANLLDL